MRRNLIVLFIAAVAIGAAVWAEEQPWFDLEKCGFCKQIGAQPGLVDHMKSDYFDLRNGMLSVTHIDTEYLPAFKKALEGMRPVVQDLAAGKPVYTCRHCTELGALYMAGVAPEQVESGENIYVVYQATDSTLIARIHKFRADCTAGEEALEKGKANGMK